MCCCALQLFPSFKQFAEAALTDEFAIAPRFTTYRLVPYDQLQQYYQQYVPQLVRHAGVARMLPQIADNLVAAMQQQVAGNKKRFIPRLRFGGVAKVLREQPRAIRANLQVRLDQNVDTTISSGHCMRSSLHLHSCLIILLLTPDSCLPGTCGSCNRLQERDHRSRILH